MLLQMGVPGGPELVILLLIAILLFGIPVVLVVVLGALWLRSDDEEAVEEQLAELQAEVTQLRLELREERGDDET